MAPPVPPDPPEVPELVPSELGGDADSDALVLCEALVEGCEEPVTARSVRVEESALHGVTIGAGTLTELVLRDARLSDCDLRGADFRGAGLVDCTMRGTALDAIAGVESLRGLTMPWTDLVGSVGALAAALGISVETE